jgi:putative component of toxin-antitoxin plasmid stabilization module
MYYEVKTIPLFDDKFSKIIPINKQKDVNRRIAKLSNQPYVGKPLGFKYLRELKIDKFRIYYIIFDREVIVLMVNVSDKKHQQETINFIKSNAKTFNEMIKNLNNKR